MNTTQSNTSINVTTAIECQVEEYLIMPLGYIDDLIASTRSDKQMIANENEYAILLQYPVACPWN